MKGILTAYLDKQIAYPLPDRYVHRPWRQSITIASGNLPDWVLTLEGEVISVGLQTIVEYRNSQILASLCRIMPSEDVIGIESLRSSVGMSSPLHIILGWVEDEPPVLADLAMTRNWGTDAPVLSIVSATIEFREF